MVHADFDKGEQQTAHTIDVCASETVRALIQKEMQRLGERNVKHKKTVNKLRGGLLREDGRKARRSLQASVAAKDTERGRISTE